MDGDDALGRRRLAHRPPDRPVARCCATRCPAFRYGDGFSHARAFALQLALATVPLVIAGAGLATAVGAESVAQVVARTVVAVSPGSGDQLLADVVARGSAELPEEARRGERLARRERRRARRRVRPHHRVPRDDQRRSPSSSAAPTASTAPSATGRRCASTPAPRVLTLTAGTSLGRGPGADHRRRAARRRRRGTSTAGATSPRRSSTSCAGPWGSRRSSSRSPCCSGTRRGATSPGSPGSRSAPA